MSKIKTISIQRQFSPRKAILDLICLEFLIIREGYRGGIVLMLFFRIRQARTASS